MLGLSAFQQLKLEVAHICLNYPKEHPKKKLCKKASINILSSLEFTLTSKFNKPYKKEEKFTDKLLEEVQIGQEDRVNYAAKVLAASIGEDQFIKVLREQIEVAKADDGTNFWETGSSFHRDLRADLIKYYTLKQREQGPGGQKIPGAAPAMSAEEVEALRKSATEKDEKIGQLTKEMAGLKDQLLTSSKQVTDLLAKSKGIEETDEYKKAKADSLRLEGEAKNAFVAQAQAEAKLAALQETHQQLQQERDSLVSQLKSAQMQAFLQEQQINDLQAGRGAAPSVMGGGIAPSVGTSISGAGSRPASTAARYEDKYAEYKERFSSHISPYRLFVFETLLEKYADLKEVKGPGRARVWKDSVPAFIKTCFESLIRDTFDKCGKPLNTQEWINATFSEAAMAGKLEFVSLRATLLKPPHTSSHDMVAEQPGLTVRYYLSKMVSDGYYLPQNTELGALLKKQHEAIEKEDAYNPKAVRGRMSVPLFTAGVAGTTDARRSSGAQLTRAQAQVASTGTRSRQSSPQRS